MSHCHGDMRFYGFCARKPTVERDGKSYCWQHDPVRLKQKADKAWAARKIEIANMEARADAAIARRILIEKAGLKELSEATLQEIISLGGLDAILNKIRKMVQPS